MLDWETPVLPIATQARLLGLNRTSLYYEPQPPSAEELLAKRRIDELYTAYPFYGVRRMTVALQLTLPIGQERVRRYMREMGLVAIYPGPNLSRRGQATYIYPYLLRGLAIERVNQVWGIDLTFIRMRTSWLYLIAVLDWFSRYVPAWALVDSLAGENVLALLHGAFAQATPEILNSDQGSQFTWAPYIELLRAHTIAISMDGRGRALDNVFTERLWRSVKYEEVFLHDYAAPREAHVGLAGYFEFYNHVRPHQALGYRIPAEVYFGRSGSGASTIDKCALN
jgi:putative transposase